MGQSLETREWCVSPLALITRAPVPAPLFRHGDLSTPEILMYACGSSPPQHLRFYAPLGIICQIYLCYLSSASYGTEQLGASVRESFASCSFYTLHAQ